MNVEQMRSAISSARSNLGWKNKVARMPDDQVIAIYFSFLQRGVFDGRREVKKQPVQKVNTPVVPVVKQLSIFDFI